MGSVHLVHHHEGLHHPGTHLSVTATPLKDEPWTSFKKTYNKVYRDYNEEQERRVIFESELAEVEHHNARYAKGLVTYTAGVNQFSDWTMDEWRASLTAKAPERKAGEGVTSKVAASSAHDWRDSNIVTAVKNQGHCGSCWSFAVTGAVEGAWAKAHGDLWSLSEQELIDCGRGGCDGGWTSAAYDTIMAQGGIATETSYPYEARDGTCRYDSNDAVASVRGYEVVSSYYNEDNMKNVLYDTSPLTVLIDASPDSFKRYSGGIYNDPYCPTYSINHAVLAVGYDVSSNDDGSKYWIVKNSWDTTWGEYGYVRMAYGVNQCNIQYNVDYPMV